MIALLSINFGICYLYAPSKRRFIFSPAPSSCSSFWGFSYWKLWDHVASYDSLPTTKVASAIACMRFVHWVSSRLFLHLFWLPFSQFLFQTRYIQTTESTHIPCRTAAHGSHSNNNTCICSFGSHARTVIIMWWFHNIFKLAHTKCAYAITRPCMQTFSSQIHLLLESFFIFYPLFVPDEKIEHENCCCRAKQLPLF